MKTYIGAVIVLLVLSNMALAQNRSPEVQELLEKAGRAGSSGNVENGFSYLKQAQGLAPEDAIVLKNLAVFAAGLEKWDEANLYWTAYLVCPGVDPNVMEAARAGKAKAIRMIPKRATLSITTEPAGAKVWVNGAAIGDSPVSIEVAPGKDLKVTATLLDHKPAQPVILKLSNSEARTASLKLEKIIFMGEVKFAVKPGDSVDIYVDTVKVGTSLKSLKLPEGRYLVCFQKDGYNRWWRYVNIARNRTEELEVVLREKDRATQPCTENWVPD